MGLFSSKKKTYVYSSATRMLDDADVVNANQRAITDYLLRDSLQTSTTLKEMSIVDYMNEATLNNLPAKWRRAHQRAKAQGYVYGVPTSNIVLQESTDFENEIVQMLEASAMGKVELIYAHADEMNYFHVLMQKLVSTYGWNPTTNELTVISQEAGTPVFLQDAVMQYPTEFLVDVVDEDLMSQWGYSASSGRTHARVENRQADHTYWEENLTSELVRAVVTTTSTAGDQTIEVTFEDYDETQDYIMVSYLTGGEVRYFTGKFGTGEYPRIDQVYLTNINYGDFYPRMYARVNYQNLSEPHRKETDAYKSCQNLWRVADLDWANWVEQLHQNMEDVEDIPQVFVTCSIPANTGDKDQLEYLFKWFQKLYMTRERGRTSSVQEQYRARKVEFINNNVRDGLSLTIRDNIYTQIVSFSHIGNRVVTGKLGDVGSYHYELAYVVDRGRMGWHNREVSTQVHRYKFQITEDTYHVISVYGLSSSEEVLGGKRVVSTGDSDTLLIPVDATMQREMSARDYEVVMAKGLHIIVNTVKVVKTKWYQRGAFKFVMFVVAIVITVWTGGAGWGLIAVAKAIAVSVAITVAVSLATKLLIKIGVAVEVMMVVAVVAAVVVGYVNFNNVNAIAGMSAQTLTRISNAALQIQANMTQYEMQSLMKQMQNLGQEHEDRMKELQELKDDVAMQSQILNNALWIAPDFSGAYIKLGESPDDYYTRTIHAGNIGPAVIDVTLGSIGEMLTLPRPQTTIQQIHGGI